MKIPHLVITSHEQPSVFMAEANNLWIENIPPRLFICISEPLWKSLYGKSCSPETHSYGFG